MLAVVKRHHTDTPLFEVKGEIPSEILEYLKDKFPGDVQSRMMTKRVLMFLILLGS